MARLGDIFVITSGGTPNRKKNEYYDNGTVPWVKTGDLKEKYVPFEVDCITEEGVKNSSAKRFPIGTVLVAMYGATIGACSILPYEATTNQACAAFLPNESVLSDFLYYFLRSKKEQFIKDGVGGAQPNISASYLRNVEMSIPSFEEQQKIVESLDEVDSLLSLRKQQLAKLDELVKSRFIEMFGDPIDNPLNWKVSAFKEVVYFQEGPGVRNWQFRESGIKLINIRNLVDDNLVLENTSNYLSEQEVDEKYKHFLLDVGDYVMASSGVTWGKIAEIFEEHLPLCLNTSIIRLRPYDENIISKKYLFHYIKGDAFRTQIKRLITGSAQPNFGPTHLKQISILVPPIELQNQFAAFVEQTDKSKLSIQQSIDQLETLKKSLMQKYFG